MFNLRTRIRYISPLPMKGWDVTSRNIKLIRGVILRFSSSSSEKSSPQKQMPPMSVADFYAGKSIFITGGTGYIGKMYIQKLLYNCPNINKIYLLIRANSKDHANKRIANMVENSFQLFKKLQQERPADIKKLVPVIGELEAPNLGIVSDDERLILDQVSIVIHAAASIKFHEKLKIAYDYNVEGTKKTLDLAKRMKNIQAFIHISTIFCAIKAGEDIITESLQPPPDSLKNINTLLKDYGHMKPIPPEKMDGFPYTYTFTKAIAEEFVASNHGDIPTAIIRPSLVVNSKEDPYSGWVDRISPHSYFLLAMGRGIIRCVFSKNTVILDIVPVDYVANLMIVAPTKCKRSKNIDIYNCGTSGCNPVKFDTVARSFIKDCVQHKFYDLPFPSILYTQSMLVWLPITYLVQIIPAKIVDIWCKLRGKPSRHLKDQRMIITWLKAVAFLMSGSWRARSDKMRQLFSYLSDDDKKRFPFDPVDISWKDFLRDVSRGVRNVYSKINTNK